MFHKYISDQLNSQSLNPLILFGLWPFVRIGLKHDFFQINYQNWNWRINLVQLKWPFSSEKLCHQRKSNSDFYEPVREYRLNFICSIYSLTSNINGKIRSVWTKTRSPCKICNQHSLILMPFIKIAEMILIQLKTRSQDQLIWN